MPLSLRTELAKVGYTADEPIIFSSFFLAPRSLRAVMRSAQGCTSFTQEVPGDEWDANWTEEIQGVAFKQDRWFFVRNQDDKKVLHVLRHGDMKKLMAWNLTSVPPPDDMPGFQFFHFGAIQTVGEELFIDHWVGNRGQILVMRGDEHSLNFVRWIKLDPIPGGPERVGMIAVNEEAGRIITSDGEINVKTLYLHDMEGKYLNQSVALSPGIQDGCYAQGGFWSPNNHIYVSSGQGGLGDPSRGHQYIYCFSPLKGHMMGKIAVPTEEGKQELEGCCFAPVVRDGKAVQIHCVLLENEGVNLSSGIKSASGYDDIYFKSFSGFPVEYI